MGNRLCMLKINWFKVCSNLPEKMKNDWRSNPHDTEVR